MENLINSSKVIVELLLPSVRDLELIKEYGLFTWTWVFLIKLLVWTIIFYILKSSIKVIGKRVVKYMLAKNKIKGKTIRNDKANKKTLK